MTGLADLGEVPALPRSVPTRCPVSWARRFPLRFARSPPFAALRRCGPRSVTMGHSHVHQPVGYSVAFLRWPSRSRFSAGWVTSPRIVIPPLISLSGQKLGRMVEYARLMVRSASVDGAPAPRPRHGGGVVLCRERLQGKAQQGNGQKRVDDHSRQFKIDHGNLPIRARMQSIGIQP